MKTLIALVIAMTVTHIWADTKVVMCHAAKFKNGGRDFLVQTTIPGNFKTLEGITMALMIQGSQIKNKEISTDFSPKAIENSSHFKGTKPLINYFRGARIKDGIIILSFSEDAMRYLNHTVSIQEIIKGSIEATLKLHFPKTKALKYEIDGEIVEDWDA